MAMSFGSSLRAAISVSEMARMLHMSRARFYKLISAGVMPPPCYLIRTRKPFYSSELQEKCLRVRRQGEGINGEPVVFYANRGSSIAKMPSKPKSRNKPKAKPNSMLESLLNGLKQLGMVEPDANTVKELVSKMYPRGIASESQGEVLASVFRRLKRHD